VSIKTLAVFDFDGTLFRSPEKPDWWPEKGWWSKHESLGPPCVPEKPGADWWVPGTVEAAKKCIGDSETFAVLCTGRLAGKFHTRMFELLSHAGLRFDEVHLTPGGGTLPFKLKIIESLIGKLKPEKVEVWEDRSEHVGAFKSLCEQFGTESEIHLVSTKSHPLECTQEDMASRVAARFMLRTGGFIPDKFWTQQKAELRKILLEELRDKRPDHVSYILVDRLIPFFKRFHETLLGFGMHRFAEDALKNRVETIQKQIEDIAKNYEEFAQSIRHPYPVTTVEEEMVGTILSRVSTVFEEKVKNLRDALKGKWWADPHRIQAFAAQLVHKAPPEVRKALEEELHAPDHIPSNDAIHIKWQYLGNAKLDQAAKRLVRHDTKASKLDPLKWIDFLHDVFASYYTEPEAFTEFDFHGVKVVVDDSSVDQMDIKRYVKHIDHAYELLKQKHLEKVWYGTFFIQCQQCGGVNKNTGGGVGGNYPIGPDVVNIFIRPDKFIVELLAHELGHRYWFKFMHESQRARFESLVKVHKKPKWERPKGLSSVSEGAHHQAQERVADALALVNKPLHQLQDDRGTWFKTVIEKHANVLVTAGHEFVKALMIALNSTDATNFLTDLSTEVAQLFEGEFKAVNEAANAVYKKLLTFESQLPRRIEEHPEPTTAPPNVNAWWWAIYEDERNIWIHEVNRLLAEAKKAAEKYLDVTIEAYNRKVMFGEEEHEKTRTKEFEEDPRPVTPVSDYGKSNIDEAFAEVFAHYVLEMDMNRDQLESFRSVLSSVQEHPQETGAEWAKGYFTRHPKLHRFAPAKVLDHKGGSGSHPEARQDGDNVLLFEKFWKLDAKTRDYVFTHELGHLALSKHGLAKFIKEMEALGVNVWESEKLPFGQFNMDEAFADSFATYFLNRAELKQRYPEWDAGVHGVVGS
jgi:hypothetical protein